MRLATEWGRLGRRVSALRRRRDQDHGRRWWVGQERTSGLMAGAPHAHPPSGYSVTEYPEKVDDTADVDVDELAAALAMRAESHFDM